MTERSDLPRQVQLMRGDLSESFRAHVESAGESAWDIETSGLDWAADRIGTCQVATRQQIAIVQITDDVPRNLSALLEGNVRKVFHHAPFDLRFMAYHWNVRPAAVACTKVASKILSPGLSSSDHSLLPVLHRHLGVTISKAEQRSDWLSGRLTPEQLAYAATDVAYLLELLEHLTKLCWQSGTGPLLEESFAYLPTRVMLDLRGSGDVFAY